MDYATWDKHRDELHNEEMRPFCKLSKEAQEAMKEAYAGSALIEGLTLDGDWIRTGKPSWYKGSICRVSPVWPGPAKPEPVVEYVDKDVFRQSGTIWLDNPNPYTCSARYSLTIAASLEGFAGYVYDVNGKEMCFSKLLIDPQPDCTYRLRVPKAVRFVKGAV